MSNEMNLIALWAALLGRHYGGGKSPYEYAVEGGYVGTEAEFSARLALLLDSGTLLTTVDESNRITVTGLLADGDYTVSYLLKHEDGTTEEVAIGPLTLGETDPVTYTVTWLNHDGSVLKTDTVTEGETPAYSGTTPAKAEDDSYTYTFSGWTPAIVAATANATYTATFTATAKPAEPSEPTNFAVTNESNTTDWSIWCNDARFGSDGGYRALSGNVVTNYIALEIGDIIYFEGLNIPVTGTSMNQGFAGYDANKELTTASFLSFYINGNYMTVTASGNGHEINTAGLADHDTGKNTTLFRLSGGLTGELSDVVINIKRNGVWR